MELLIGISREARLRVIELGKNWNHFLLLGCALLLGGVIAVTIPLTTVTDPVRAAGWVILACGFIQLFQALRVQGTETFRWWLAFGGIWVLLAVAILQNPIEQDISTVNLVASLLLALSALKILYAYRLRPAHEWGWLIISGVLSLILSTLLVTHALSFNSILVLELINSGFWLALIGWGFNTLNERLRKQLI